MVWKIEGEKKIMFNKLDKKAQRASRLGGRHIQFESFFKGYKAGARESQIEFYELSERLLAEGRANEIPQAILNLFV